MRFPILIIVCLIPTQALADGWTSISGKNKNGASVNWSYVYDPSVHHEYEVTPNQVSEDAHGTTLSAPITVLSNTSRPVTYKSQICTFEYDVHEFSCSKDGTSPLAGAVYIMTTDPGECGGTIYTLKKGTGKRDAPRRMYQPPWEC